MHSASGSVRGAAAKANALGFLGLPSTTAPQDAASTERQCAESCDSNGYSWASAGPAAARACVEVCLTEKGVRSGGPSSLAKAAVVRLPHPSPSRARAADGARGRRMPHTPMARGGLAAEGPSLSSFVRRLRVSSAELPRSEARDLSKAETFDAAMLDKASSARGAMKRLWESGVRDMAKFEAARLANAHGLAETATKALTDNRATIEADAKIISDASTFTSETGSERADALPVDVGRARKQLDKARGRESALEEAASGAEVLLRKEELARAGGMAHAQSVLAAPSWARHEGAEGARGWGREVEAARQMPQAAAKAARVEAMSEGRLRGMEKKLYEATRGGEERLARDVRREHEARVAAVRLLEEGLRREAGEVGRQAKLAIAREAFLTQVKEIGGKGAPTADKLEQVRDAAEREAAQARELVRTGEAADGLLRSVGAEGLSPLTVAGKVELQQMVRAGAETLGGKEESASPAEGDLSVGEEGGKEGGASKAAGGAAAVEDASKGWFSW